MRFPARFSRPRDPPSKYSLRRKIELGAVSLLSNFTPAEGSAIDEPSASWLGCDVCVESSSASLSEDRKIKYAILDDMRLRAA